MKWEYEEEILLVDLYLYSKKNSKNDTDKEIELLSELLNHRAKKLGYNVEDTFRNVTGIKMKLQNIKYVFSQGETGLSAVSEMDSQISRFAIEEPEQFELEVTKIKKELAVHDKENNEINTVAHDVDSSNTDDNTLPYYQLFGYNLDEYIDLNIINQSFSTRATNCLSREKIVTVSDLLKLNRAELLEVKFLGKKCISEIETFILSLDEITKKHIVADYKTAVPDLYTTNKELLAIGDFSFLQMNELSENEEILLSRFKEAFEVLGAELASNCIHNPLYVNSIVNVLTSFINETTVSLSRKSILEDMIHELPINRINKCNIGYVNAYSVNENNRKILMQIFQNSDMPLTSISSLFEKNDDDFSYSTAKKFLKWCSFDISNELSEFFTMISENENRRAVLSLRAQNSTLEQVGTKLGKTRERIRQIEAKIQRLFDHWENTHRIILKISAELNSNRVLTFKDISSFYDEYPNEFIYLSKNHYSKHYIFDSQLEVFIIGESTEIQDEIQSILDTLPDVININQLESIAESFCLNTNVPPKAICLYVKNTYRLTGDVYHITRLSRVAVYSNVITKYYPDGIKAYDSDELLTFRSIIDKEYGDINLPSNNRALTARIADCCILCGRGIYKPKQDKYIPDELINKIENYIDNSSSQIFLTNTILDVFEGELNLYGIDNKYFLQGVLHEAFGDKYLFRRDYISKDRNITTIYSGIIDFLKSSPYPVSKEQIYEKYPGITEIIINFAVSDNSILNYFGEYLHSVNLKFTDNDILYLRNTLTDKLSDGESHHCKDLYEFIIQDNRFILTSNGIFMQFSLFSVLEYLFANDFQFSRPYIANHGISIGRPAERLRALIYSNDKFEINGISDFVKENYYQIQCLLDYFNTLNNDYFILDNDYLISLTAVGITVDVAKEVEKAILSEINTYMWLQNLTCINKLPRIKVPWTNWLIYSTINRWGENLFVTTNTKFFKAAIPIVYLRSMDEKDVLQVFNAQYMKDNVSEAFHADNLDDIDDLISDYIEEEL